MISPSLTARNIICRKSYKDLGAIYICSEISAGLQFLFCPVNVSFIQEKQQWFHTLAKRKFEIPYLDMRLPFPGPACFPHHKVVVFFFFKNGLKKKKKKAKSQPVSVKRLLSKGRTKQKMQQHKKDWYFKSFFGMNPSETVCKKLWRACTSDTEHGDPFIKKTKLFLNLIWNKLWYNTDPLF